MNSPDGDSGGLIVGSHESCVRRVSCQVAPPSFERASHVSMNVFPGWAGGRGRSSRRSKKDTSTWPLGVTRTYCWNWSAFVWSWLTRTGAVQVVPPSLETVSLTSACAPSSSGVDARSGL